MYRTVKNLPILLLLLVFCLVNCEGRRSSNQALKQDINEFNKNVSIERITYVPETYFEHTIDTSFSHGLSVTMKYYPDMTNSVLHTFIKDTVNHQTHFRTYKFEVLLEKNGTNIYNKVFDKNSIIKRLNKNNLKNLKEELNFFKDNAILHSVSINHETSTSKAVTIDLFYKIPKKEPLAHFTMQIDDDGNANFSLVNIR